MHKNIDEIKKLESSPKIIKNLFDKKELDEFFNLYQNLPTTVHNKKQNVIKKRWLKNYNEKLEKLFFEKVGNQIPQKILISVQDIYQVFLVMNNILHRHDFYSLS